jgi:sortase A
MGLVAVLLGVFQANIANLSERRAQRALRGEFLQVMDAGIGLGRDAQGHVHPIRPGDPVAYIDIDRIGVHAVVVEGATASSLKKGPGVAASGVLPGQPGQTIIVGRRTSYGGPFRHIDALSPGDEIKTTTPYGAFTYRVREKRTIDSVGSSDFPPATGSLLTLVTSDPPYVGGGALVVAAAVEGHPSSFPDPARADAGGDQGYLTLAGSTRNRAGALVLGVLLLAALVVTDRLYGAWRRWPTYLLTTPVILMLAFVWMETLTSLFPSSM